MHTIVQVDTGATPASSVIECSVIDSELPEKRILGELKHLRSDLDTWYHLNIVGHGGIYYPILCGHFWDQLIFAIINKISSNIAFDI